MRGNGREEVPATVAGPGIVVVLETEEVPATVAGPGIVVA
jgi:hypothetical protein